MLFGLELLRLFPEPGLEDHGRRRRNTIRRQSGTLHQSAGHDARPDVFVRIRFSPQLKVRRFQKTRKLGLSIIFLIGALVKVG